MKIKDKLVDTIAGFKYVIKRDLKIYIIVLSSIFLFKISFYFLGIEKDFNRSLYSILSGIIVQFSLVVSFFAYSITMIIKRQPRPLVNLVKIIYNYLKNPYEIISFIVMVYIINVVISCYTVVKTTIGHAFPFSYDLDFYNLDKYIHFNIAPWKITHYIFNSPYATLALNFLYNIWFFIIWLTLFAITISKHKIREQYIISFILVWVIGGNILAILLSSAGPCYFEYIVSQPLYQELFEILNQQDKFLYEQYNLNIWVLNIQAFLWDNHLINGVEMGSGISAMPSMHVSMSVLGALATYRINRYLGYFMWLYALTIQIGSVHLGWHYAVDGYVGAIFTICIWKLSAVFCYRK